MKCCTSPSTPGQRCCRIAGHLALGALLGLALAAAFGLAVKLLWNCVMPGLFPVHAIGFGQAVGLVLLARLLFGRFGCHGGPFGHWRRRHGWHRHEGSGPEDEGRWGHGCCGKRDAPETPEAGA